jgi:hypothetical protein
MREGDAEPIACMREGAAEPIACVLAGGAHSRTAPSSPKHPEIGDFIMG